MAILDHKNIVRRIAKLKASLETARSKGREATYNTHVQKEIENILERVRETQKRITRLCYCPACGEPLTWNQECTYEDCKYEH